MAALSTALLVSGIAAAGGAVGGAAISAHAAGKAADQQAESAREALALQKQVYQQNRADTAPWRAQGSAAVNTLGALMGLPAGQNTDLPSTSNHPFYRNAFQGGADLAQKFSDNPNLQVLPDRSRPGALTPESTYQTLPDRMGGRGPVGMALPLSAIGGGGQSSYVQMRAPTGETQMVDPAQVPHYEQLGATVIGRGR